jgi:M6 family metalloprotease-like protein
MTANKLRFLLVSFLTIPALLHAVPLLPGRPHRGNTCLGGDPNAAQVRLQAYREALRMGVLPAPPTVKNPQVLIIRVDFSDQVMTQTAAQSQVSFDKVSAFYAENSYGVFVPSFTVTNDGTGGQGAYRLPRTLRGTYGPDCGTIGSCGGQDIACNDAPPANPNLRDDSVNKVSSNYKFSNYDHLMILHAGNGEEATCASTDIWSVFFPGTFTPQGSNNRQGQSYSGFAIVPETEAGADPFGVAAHEYGHQLGLPDLYDTATGNTVVGSWALMNTPYGGNPPGSNPGHHDIWSKLFLGFVSTTTTSGRVLSMGVKGASLNYIEGVSNGFYQLPLSNVSSVGVNEYFLIEYRRPDSSLINFDLAAPTTGMLIWHIDDSIASNASHLGNNDVNAPETNGAGRYGVTLVQQNGTTTTSGVSGDAFKDGNTFQTPQSNAFNGQQSGIVVSNISGTSSNPPNRALVFDSTTTATLQESSALSILKVINYPNPAGRDYPAKPGFLTTLVLQTSKRAGAVTLDIYDILGNRVKNVGTNDIKLQAGGGLGPSQSFKFVYEYDWDGTNSDGKMVGPTVYLYRFKADDQAATGKMVIIR